MRTSRNLPLFTADEVLQVARDPVSDYYWTGCGDREFEPVETTHDAVFFYTVAGERHAVGFQMEKVGLSPGHHAVP